jgi:hypothetical protein
VSLTEYQDQANGRLEYLEQLSNEFRNSLDSLEEKLENFSKYVPVQSVGRLLARYEFFKMTMSVPGSIVELGTYAGAGFFSFIHCGLILEPTNQHRRIVGFDTFSGFPALSKIDKTGSSGFLEVGALSSNSFEEQQKLALVHEGTRFFKGRKQYELVKGDVCSTLPAFLVSNPEFIVSLLYLDLDLYEPTKLALELLLPRIPKGGVIVFDELGLRDFPGETVAMFETMDYSSLSFRKLPFIKASYCVL